MPALTPEALHQAGLPDNVYELLVQELSWGDLAPGSPLSIDGLSRQLGVSPTPVREALARLEATGMVTREARRGYRVAPPMSDEEASYLAQKSNGAPRHPASHATFCLLRIALFFLAQQYP